MSAQPKARRTQADRSAATREALIAAGRRLFAAHGFALPPGRTETQSVSVARALTFVSDTVWITPQRPVQLDLDRRWLRRLNVPVPGSAEPVGILSRSGVPPSELAAQLMDTLRELP